MKDEKSKDLLLKWNETTGEFDPIESDNSMDEGIFIELIADENKWKYFYIKGASLIARRTSLRAANGIAKTGYIHPDNQVRCGPECKLEEEVSPYKDMPKELRNSQRSWYKGDYKQF
jgi:hypothetical protein